MTVDTKYSYGDDPSNNDFKRLVHGDGQESIHPWLTLRENQAQGMVSEIPRIPIPENADPRLHIHEADQGLVLTPFDSFEGMRVEIPPAYFLEGWKVSHDYNLKLANHPARIHAMRALEAKGFKAPEAQKSVLDSEAEKNILLQLADLGHANALTIWGINSQEWQNISQRIRRLRQTSEEDSGKFSEREEDFRRVQQFVDTAISHKQTHRTELLATGPFSLIKGKAFSFIGIGAMPDITASVLMGETAAKMFVPFCLPRETGKYSSPENQAALARAILERLTIDDPLLEGRALAEKQYIVDHWRSCLIGTLEVDKEKAMRRFDMLREAGVKSFRPYGHTEGGDVVETIRILRKEDPQAALIASQITTISEALACWQEGADEIIIGVGSGGRCTTAQLSQLIPTNALLAWRLRGLVDIPIWGEGGAIDEPIVSLLVGMSGVNGSGSIGGGTFEAPGGMYYLTKDGQSFVKPYGGEASSRFKHLSRRTYPTGIPYFPEGEQTFKELIPLEESTTQKIINHWQRIILGAVVLGISNGPFSYSDMQNITPSPLWEKTRTVTNSQGTH